MKKYDWEKISEEVTTSYVGQDPNKPIQMECSHPDTSCNVVCKFANTCGYATYPE